MFNDPLVKREIFAVSLRKERKRVILEERRNKIALKASFKIEKENAKDSVDFRDVDGA